MLSTTQKKFGETSLYVNGAAYLRYVPGITFGGKDFAIAAWVYAPSATSAINFYLGWGDSDTRILIGRTADNFFRGLIGDALHTATPDASRPTFTTNQWNHIEVDYRQSDNTLFFFFNGELVDSQADANFATARTFPFYIGYALRSTTYFTGYIDDFFITEQLLHSENFEPQTEPYAFDSDKTIALLHFEN